MPRLVGGLVYFCVTYAAGFVFGWLRQRVLAPSIGATPALLIEAPLMLAVIFFAARAVVAGLPPASDRTDRIVVGLVGFAALMVTELAMGAILRSMTVIQWLAAFATTDGVISLILFVLFAAMPMLVGYSQNEQTWRR